ncbi:MAG: cysteine--tRNA ligase [bacterium]
MLKIYNSATKYKQEFIPIIPFQVRMYNCGLTVYSYAQIGNLRAYTMADTIRRTLEFLGYDVKQVMNFTDVGHLTFTDEEKKKMGEREINDSDKGLDRMEKAAKRDGKTAWEVADFYIKAAMEDFKDMNFKEPFKRPRATEYINEQIEMIKTLLDKGYAYITPSAIFFDTSKDTHYGELTGQNLNDKKIGVREAVEVDENKKNPSDFRLWQLDQKDHQMQWDSPWGKGFPGWHIECSAMSKALLGDTIDIHTGGIDNLPVHHVNETAQSEATNGVPFVNFWYHNEFLTVDGKKMSKSLGNVYSLKDIKDKGFDPMDLRYLYFLVNFRMKQNFTFEALEQARNARLKLLNFIHSMPNAQNDISEINEKDYALDPYMIKFKEAIEDSFNMPEAVAVVWEVVKSDASERDKARLLYSFDLVLGLRLFEENKVEDPGPTMKLEQLIRQRTEAKNNKDYKKADELREEAKELGYEIYDGKDGMGYRKIN